MQKTTWSTRSTRGVITHTVHTFRLNLRNFQRTESSPLGALNPAINTLQRVASGAVHFLHFAALPAVSVCIMHSLCCDMLHIYDERLIMFVNLWPRFHTSHFNLIFSIKYLILIFYFRSFACILLLVLRLEIRPSVKKNEIYLLIVQSINQL